MGFNVSMNNNTPNPSPLWNDIVDEAVFNLMDKEGGNTHAMHSLLSSLKAHGFIEGYVSDVVPCDMEGPLSSEASIPCFCKFLDHEGCEDFILRKLINTTTSHSAWLVYNSRWGHAPFVLVYSTPTVTHRCCDHVMDHPTPKCEFLSDEAFKPFERLGEPDYIWPHDYRAVAELMGHWVLDDDRESWGKV